MSERIQETESFLSKQRIMKRTGLGLRDKLVEGLTSIFSGHFALAYSVDDLERAQRYLAPRLKISPATGQHLIELTRSSLPPILKSHLKINEGVRYLLKLRFSENEYKRLTEAFSSTKKDVIERLFRETDILTYLSPFIDVFRRLVKFEQDITNYSLAKFVIDNFLKKEGDSYYLYLPIHEIGLRNRENMYVDFSNTGTALLAILDYLGVFSEQRRGRFSYSEFRSLEVPVTSLPHDLQQRIRQSVARRLSSQIVPSRFDRENTELQAPKSQKLRPEYFGLDNDLFGEATARGVRKGVAEQIAGDINISYIHNECVNKLNSLRQHHLSFDKDVRNLLSRMAEVSRFHSRMLSSTDVNERKKALAVLTKLYFDYVAVSRIIDSISDDSFKSRFRRLDTLIKRARNISQPHIKNVLFNDIQREDTNLKVDIFKGLTAFTLNGKLSLESISEHYHGYSTKYNLRGFADEAFRNGIVHEDTFLTALNLIHQQTMQLLTNPISNIGGIRSNEFIRNLKKNDTFRPVFNLLSHLNELGRHSYNILVNPNSSQSEINEASKLVFQILSTYTTLNNLIRSAYSGHEEAVRYLLDFTRQFQQMYAQKIQSLRNWQKIQTI